MNLMRSLFGGAFNLPGPFGQMQNLLQQFRIFSRDPIGNILRMKNVNVPQNFNGTPKDLVNQLVNSGQMSKEQFEQFGQQANEIQNMLPRF